MSEFKNFFQKQDNTKNLQYDNVAFLHFATTITFLAILIILVLIIKDIFFNKKFQLLTRVPKNPLFKNQISNEKKHKNKYYKSKKFIFKLILLISLSLICYSCLYFILSQQNKLKGFDPYQLLGVQYDTPIRTIRKKYRALAFSLHPDKNPSNPEVATQFILVSKAYECLTNQQLKDNCLKYGNPEGNQIFNVGIALPSFLLNKDHQLIVLVIEFIILLIILPKIFIDWNNKLQIRDQRGVLLSNYKLLYKYLKQKLTNNKIMLMIAQMKQVEHKQLKGQIDHIQIHQKTNSNYENEKINEKSQFHIKQQQNQKTKKLKVTASTTNNLKNIVDYIGKKHKSSMIIRKMPQLVKSVINFSLDFCTDSKKRKLRLFPNRRDKHTIFLGTDQLDKLICWSQMFYQSSSFYTSNGIENLSINSDEIKMLNKYRLRDLIKQQNNRNQFLNKINLQRRKIVEQQIKSLPNLELSVQLLLQGQKIQIVTQRDTILIRIILNKINPGHCISYLKYFPFLKQQKYYLTIQSNNNSLMYFQQLIFLPNQNQIVSEYSYSNSSNCQQQQITFIIKVRSDCYMGLDLQKIIRIKIKPYEGTDCIFVHNEDENIQKQKKGIIQSMFSLEKFENNSDNQLSDSQQKNKQVKQNHKKLDKLKQQIQQVYGTKNG